MNDKQIGSQQGTCPEFRIPFRMPNRAERREWCGYGYGCVWDRVIPFSGLLPRLRWIDRCKFIQKAYGTATPNLARYIRMAVRMMFVFVPGSFLAGWES